ncbi:hypothetical protein GA0115240_15643 [Streptomyces sp. DvalAA-14]|uniref:hypothetical protein n=1 Tax=unclassified Streptomyces TaxID=2593676 RepID=UPI00081AF0D4|nr:MULTISPECIES: hypothetical protein [unclassified Streptomyces]MYS23776.1 hypothetical protein [Streptomyces sp. SID4948]SCE38596.1 hypothetical protein GA0115240_15643 [Streptomyces sp. DvalAA-14]
MERHLHHELMGVCSAVCAAVVSAAVAFGVRGLPTLTWKWEFTWPAAGLVLLVLAAEIPIEKRAFDSAVALDDPGAVLPADDALRHHLFDGRFLATLLVPTLIGSLVWEPWVSLWPLSLVAGWMCNAAYTASWERRHGLLLWRGRVEAQPLGKGQLYYSSVRPPAAVPST